MNNHLESCPDNWSIKPVNQLVEFLDGKRIPLKQEDRALMKGNIPYYGASGIIDYVNDYIFDDELILLGEDGENVVSRNLPLAFKINGKAWVNNHAHVLKPKEGYDIDFLTIRFEFQDYKAFITGSAQPKITQGILAKLEFYLPDLEKQQKISKILTTIDHLIEKTQALINKYTAFKQGMMADLFTRGIDLTTGQLRRPVEQAPHLYKETELGWVPKDWGIGLLADHLRNIEQGWSPDCDSNPAQSGHWGVLKTTSVVWGGFNANENKALPDKLQPRIEYEVQIGDVLMTRAGPGNRVGVVSYVNSAHNKLMLSDKLYRIVSNNYINNEYLALLLSSNATQSQLNATKTGLAESQSNISQDIVKKLLVAIPDNNEQKIIVKKFNTLTQKIKNEQLHLKKLKVQKQGLMQDLLTGRVFVN